MRAEFPVLFGRFFRKPAPTGELRTPTGSERFVFADRVAPRSSSSGGVALLLLFVGPLLIGCGYQNTRQEPAKLQVISEPEDARVYVDERFVASARVLAQRPRELRAGPHRVTIQAPGYFPHDVEVELPSGTTTIRISLRAVPP